ncbi:MAG: amidohydrolase family protein, partial [bacterium]|nr:amidohydrolase family protein [bacterium]
MKRGLSSISRGRSRLGILACLVASACFGFACQAPSSGTNSAEAAPNDAAGSWLLVEGGTVVTMDAAGTVVPDGAVAIEDGRITAVGPREELLLAHPEARRISAGGGVIMPGLINAHTHVPMVLFRGLADDLKLMDWLENHIFPA